VIYSLIYPGFLGSICTNWFQSTLAVSLANFFMRPDNYIRYLILAFYFLDFIHLYGDMDRP